MKIIVLSSVEKFIKELDQEIAAKVYRMLELLKIYGFELRMPYSKKVEENIFELRVRGKIEIRIFYIFYKDSSVLLHACIKKTMKIPKREILIAKKKKEYLTYYNI